MVATFNLPSALNLSISRPNTPSILSPSNPATTKTTTTNSPLINSNSIQLNDIEKLNSNVNGKEGGRTLEKSISNGEKIKLGLTNTLNALLSNPSRTSTPIPSPSTITTTTTNSTLPGLGITRPVSTGSGLPSLSLKNLHLSTTSSSPGKQRSQSAAPPLSRNSTSKALLSSSTSNVITPTSTTAPLSLLKSFLPSSSSSAPSSKKPSPTSTPLILPTQQPSSRSSTPQPQLMNLEESYVSKVNVRLSESVNKVFIMDQSSTDINLNRMNPPKYLSARKVGELIEEELKRAQSDSYLLRTLLRSTILRILSLFLTRLTALLLPSTTFPLNTTNLTTSTTEEPILSLPFKFNLLIVKSAYELKEGLRSSWENLEEINKKVVKEAFNPWILKFEELMSRVMSPIMIGFRIELGKLCSKGREGGKEVLEIPLVVGGAGNGSTSSSKASRSLSLGRSSTPLPILSSSTSSITSTSITTGGGGEWLKDLIQTLDQSGNFLRRLECGRDTEKWLVSLGTCTVWKGMLALSYRSGFNSSMSSSSSSSLNGNGNGNGASGGKGEMVDGMTQLLLSPTHSPTITTTTKTLFKSTPRTSPSLLPTTNNSSPSKLEYKALPSLLTSPKLVASTSLHTITSSVPSTSSNTTFTSSSSSSSTTTINSNNSTSSPDIIFTSYLTTLESFEQILKSYVSHLTHPCPIPNILISGQCNSSLHCSLCLTGRTFDAESSDEDEEEDEIELAGCAMRESLQALSALIIVVRASRIEGKLEEVIRFTAGGGVGVCVEPYSMNRTGGTGAGGEKEMEEIKPLTPSLFLSSPLPTFSPSSPVITIQAAPCPTLIYALDTLPLLILLQLLISLLPSSLDFSKPHELLDLNYTEYAKELRGFVSGEMMLEEIGWEIIGEIQRILDERVVSSGAEVVGKGGLNEKERNGLRLLGMCLRIRVGLEVPVI